jgi:dipeptidase E
MRLYLSSYRIGERAGALLALLGNGRRAALVANGLDHLPSAARTRHRDELYDPQTQFSALGIASAHLDLRHYFGRADALRAELQGFDLVWVLGGNTFVLRRAMKQSGFDAVIIDMLDEDRIVYGGFSAGAVVAAPTLRGIELMDDPSLVPEGYDPEPVWEGLGLIDHAIVPHYRSKHPESAGAERAARHLSARGQRYRALRDGEVVVWVEDRLRPVGSLSRSA